MSEVVSEKDELKSLNTSLETVLLELRSRGNAWKERFFLERAKIGVLNGKSADVRQILDEVNKQFKLDAEKQREDLALENAKLQKLLEEAKAKNSALTKTASSLIEDNARAYEENQKLKLNLNNVNRGLKEENKQLRNSLKENGNLKPKIQALKDALGQKLHDLTQWQARHKKFILETQAVKVPDNLSTLNSDLNGKIDQIRKKHKEVIEEQNRKIKQLQDQQFQNFTRQKTLAETNFRETAGEKLEIIRQEYDKKIKDLEDQVKALELRLSSYKVEVNFKLRAIHDFELSLRMEIKAYELLLASECKRLGLPPPKRRQPEAKLSILEAQTAHGHEIQIQNTSTEVVSIDGYRLRSSETKNEWKFPADTKIASGAVVVVYTGLDAHKKSSLADNELIADLEFAVPEDRVELVDPKGKVERFDIVFSDSPTNKS